MNLAQSYKETLDRAFEANFPNWNEMSPLDPLKVFAEGVACSLSEIEKQQSRYVNTVLDSLPTLFSFFPKTAKAPIGLFELVPHIKATQVRELQPQSVFQFRSQEETCHGVTLKTVSIYPVFDSTVTALENRISLKFTAKGGLKDIAFHYLHDATQDPSILNYVSVKTSPLRSERTTHLEGEDITIEDHTGSFTQHGIVVLKRETAKDQPFATGPAEYEIILQFEKAVPTGHFRFNVVPLSLYLKEENVELGHLCGQPWEEIPLDKDILEPPPELIIQYPDDRTLKIHRLDSNVLKLRATQPDRFSHCFFYNASNHSLIIPASHTLCHRYHGGVGLLAPTLEKIPPFDSLPNTYTGNPGEQAPLIDKLLPAIQLSGSLPRESKSDYLSRFYSAMRSFNTTHKPAKTFVPSEVQATLLACDPELRHVELAVEETTKRITVFLLTLPPVLGQMAPISESLTTKVSDVLNHIIPLDYEWKVEPFQTVPLSLDLNVEIRLDEARTGLLSENILKKRISAFLKQSVLPSPFGVLKADEVLSKEKLFEKLMAQLQVPLRDHSHLKPSEVVSVQGLVVDELSSSYLNQLIRKPGELLLPRVDIQLTLSQEPPFPENKAPFSWQSLAGGQDAS